MLNCIYISVLQTVFCEKEKYKFLFWKIVYNNLQFMFTYSVWIRTGLDPWYTNCFCSRDENLNY